MKKYDEWLYDATPAISATITTLLTLGVISFINLI